MASIQDLSQVVTNLFHPISPSLDPGTKIALCSVSLFQSFNKDHESSSDEDFILKTWAERKFMTRKVINELLGHISNQSLLSVLKPSDPSEVADSALCSGSRPDLTPKLVGQKTVRYNLPPDTPSIEPRDYTTCVAFDLGDGTDCSTDWSREKVSRRRTQTGNTQQWIKFPSEPFLAKEPQLGLDANIAEFYVRIRPTAPRGLLEMASTAVDAVESSWARSMFDAMLPELIGQTNAYVHIGNCFYTEPIVATIWGLELHQGFQYSLHLTANGIVSSRKESHRLFYPSGVLLPVFLENFLRDSQSPTDTDLGEVRRLLGNLKIHNREHNRDFYIRNLSGDRVPGEPIDLSELIAVLVTDNGDEFTALASDCTIISCQVFGRKLVPRELATRMAELAGAESLPTEDGVSAQSSLEDPSLRHTSYFLDTDRIKWDYVSLFHNKLHLIFVETDPLVPQCDEWKTLIDRFDIGATVSTLGTVDRSSLTLHFDPNGNDEHHWRAQLLKRARRGLQANRTPVFIFGTRAKHPRTAQYTGADDKNVQASMLYRHIETLCDIELGFHSHLIPLNLRKDKKADSENGPPNEKLYSKHIFHKIYDRQPPLSDEKSTAPWAIGIHVRRLEQPNKGQQDNFKCLISMVFRHLRGSGGYHTFIELQRTSSFKSLKLYDHIRRQLPLGVTEMLIYRSGHLFDDEFIKNELSPLSSSAGETMSSNKSESNAAGTNSSFNNSSTTTDRRTFVNRATAAGYELRVLKTKLDKFYPKLTIDYVLVEATSTKVHSPRDNDAQVDFQDNYNRTHIVNDPHFNVDSSTISVHRAIRDSTSGQTITRLTMCADPDLTGPASWSQRAKERVAKTMHDDYLHLHTTALPIPTYLAKQALNRAALYLDTEDEDDVRLRAVHPRLKDTLYYL